MKSSRILYSSWGSMENLSLANFKKMCSVQLTIFPHTCSSSSTIPQGSSGISHGHFLPTSALLSVSLGDLYPVLQHSQLERNENLCHQQVSQELPV